VFSCRVFDILNKAQPSSKYKTRNENTQAIFEVFSAAFAAENTSFSAGGSKLLLLHYY
jgi:hypothetical protein